MSANGFEHFERLPIAVDRILQFTAAIANVLRVQKYRRNARIDQGGLQLSRFGDTQRKFQLVDQVAGREHRALAIGRIDKFDLYLRRREGHAVEFEVSGFLYLAVGDRHPGDYGLADISLPDPHHGGAVLRNAIRFHQAVRDREGSDRGGQVAAVTAPVDEGSCRWRPVRTGNRRRDPAARFSTG